MVKEATVEYRSTKVSGILDDEVYWLGTCHFVQQ